MYLIFALILFLIIILLNIRRIKSRNRVCAMCADEKYRLLDKVLEPFHYCYLPSQDILISQTFAEPAPGRLCTCSHRIIDKLPVYFDYQNHTWLLELQKGRYGIYTGCEIGLFYGDGILTDSERRAAIFQPANHPSFMKLTFSLYYRDIPLTRLSAAGSLIKVLRAGCFCDPDELTLHIRLTFFCAEMAHAFAEGLTKAGYAPMDICFHCNSITFIFGSLLQNADFSSDSRISFTKIFLCWKCRLFLFLTRAFDRSADRILYLYYYLPCLINWFLQPFLTA